MLKKISAIQARQNLGSLMNEVSIKGDDFVIERSGKAMVVVISVEKFHKFNKLEEETTPATTKNGLPIVPREERIRILNSMPPLGQPEDSEEWIKRIKSARFEKDTTPYFE